MNHQQSLGKVAGSVGMVAFGGWRSQNDHMFRQTEQGVGGIVFSKFLVVEKW
jgi:hypothetical protein